MASRANEGNVVSPFGNLPLDSSRKEIQIAKIAQASDATTPTAVTSPVTGASATTLNIPQNAVSVTLVHDASAQASTITFNGQPGSFGLVANQLVTIPCAGEAFTTLAINPGATGTNIYFAFNLV